jgi:glycosyltransferase involved in cell wall biosynthesis
LDNDALHHKKVFILTMQNNPLVSILLLSMNHEAYLEQCIRSIAEQTYKNIEVIYLDNASSDNSFQKAKKLLELSGLPFKCFSNKTSRTISGNLNFLFDHSSGAFIAPLSTDDWFEKNNIEKKVNYFVDHKEVGALFSNGWIYNEMNQKTILNDSAAFRKGYIYKEVLTQADCIFYVGVVYKRDIINQVGKWDESLLIEDTDMYIRIGSVATIDFLDEPLVYYRRTAASASKNSQFMLNGFQQYYEKYRDVNWINMKKWLAERYRSLAAVEINQNNLKPAFRFLKVAIKLNPLGVKNIRTLFYLFRRSLQR